MKPISQFVRCFFVIFLLLSALAQWSATNGIKLPGFPDRRLIGIDTSGWTDAQFEFQDPSLAGYGAKIGFGFEAQRPNGSAQVIFEVNGQPLAPQVITSKPIYFTIDTIRNGLSIKATVTNPFHSAESQELKGVKLVRVSVDRAPLLLPNLFLVFSLASLIAAIIVVLNIKVQNLVVSFLIIALPLSILFAKNETIQWSIATWLLYPLLLCMIGLSATRLLPTPSLRTARSVPWAGLLVCLLFGIGLWLRISTVSFGLPDIFHPDESRKLNIMRGMIISGNLDPDYFRHPSFMLYSGALVGKGWSLLHQGAIPDIPTLAPLARSVSAVFGSLSIIVLFLIGSLLYSNIAGLLAAAALTFSPLHVVCSRYVKEDACMIFFMLLTLYCILRCIYQKASPRLFLIAGFATGIATSIKYTGILSASFLVAPLLVWTVGKLAVKNTLFASLIQEVRQYEITRWSFSKHLSLIIGAAVCITVGFLFITPYSIFNSERFIKDFLFEGRHMSGGHTGIISAVNYFWSYHLQMSLFTAFGSILTLIALCCLGLFSFRGDSKALIPLLGFLLFYLPAEWVNAKPFPQAERYILPTIPFLALCLGGTFVWLGTLQQTRFVAFVRSAFTMLLIVGMTQIMRASLIQHSMMMHDTRTQAKQWVEATIPSGASIVTDWMFYGPNLDTTRYNIRELKTPDQVELLRAMSPQTLQETGADYFITSSFFYDRYLFFAERGNKTGLGYLEIFQTLKPLKEFKAEPDIGRYGFHNPTIRIYKLK